MTNFVRLNKSDLAAIEYETAQIAGEPPTLESLLIEGYTESRRLNQVLDWITSAGRVGTLLIAELIQAAAALTIATVFAVLEFWRVKHGAQALGQEETQASLIAYAVVTANVVHPIYSLRQLRGQKEYHVTHMTGRGYLERWWERLTGRPTISTVDLYHDPTLHLAAVVITWSTVLLAVYDILGPLLNQLFTGKLERPLPIALMELLMGLGLSVAGVFFLQSAAHEIGVRTLTDQPPRLTERLVERRAEYDEYVSQVREAVRKRHMMAKLDEEGRKREAAITPIQAVHASQMTASVNGHSSAMESTTGKT